MASSRRVQLSARAVLHAPTGTPVWTANRDAGRGTAPSTQSECTRQPARLSEYLGSPQQHIAASESNSEVNATGKKEDIVDGVENNDKSMDNLTEENDNGESQQWEKNQLIVPLVLAKSWKVDMSNAMRIAGLPLLPLQEPAREEVKMQEVCVCIQ
ncbi:hypothetical protein ZWY2020_053433 [Hordeum vulgare]|nr:hypothetical protein ZWY2020_053433 [Hordeum vulgare]